MLHLDDGWVLSNSIRIATKAYTLCTSFHCESCGAPSEFFGHDDRTATFDDKL